MPALLTRPMREICDQTRVRLLNEAPWPNEMVYAVRGPWIYLRDAYGGNLRADINLIKQTLIDHLVSSRISIFEHNQYLALIQLMEAHARFPDDFFVWDFDFEFQMTLETWIMVNAAPLEHTHFWPDPDSVAMFPDIESVSSLHYSTDEDHWLDGEESDYWEDGFVEDDVSGITSVTGVTDPLPF